LAIKKEDASEVKRRFHDQVDGHHPSLKEKSLKYQGGKKKQRSSKKAGVQKEQLYSWLKPGVQAGPKLLPYYFKKREVSWGEHTRGKERGDEILAGKKSVKPRKSERCLRNVGPWDRARLGGRKSKHSWKCGLY